MGTRLAIAAPGGLPPRDERPRPPVPHSPAGTSISARGHSPIRQAGEPRLAPAAYRAVPVVTRTLTRGAAPRSGGGGRRGGRGRRWRRGRCGASRIGAVSFLVPAWRPLALVAPWRFRRPARLSSRLLVARRLDRAEAGGEGEGEREERGHGEDGGGQHEVEPEERRAGEPYQVRSSSIVRDAAPPLYRSDHYPVLAAVRLSPRRGRTSQTVPALTARS